MVGDEHWFERRRQQAAEKGSEQKRERRAWLEANAERPAPKPGDAVLPGFLADWLLRPDGGLGFEVSDLGALAAIELSLQNGLSLIPGAQVVRQGDEPVLVVPGGYDGLRFRATMPIPAPRRVQGTFASGRPLSSAAITICSGSETRRAALDTPGIEDEAVGGREHSPEDTSDRRDGDRRQRHRAHRGRSSRRLPLVELLRGAPGRTCCLVRCNQYGSHLGELAVSTAVSRRPPTRTSRVFVLAGFVSARWRLPCWFQALTRKPAGPSPRRAGAA